MPKPVAGSRAMITQSMMLLVDVFALIWGFEETCILSLMSASYFFFCASCILRMDLMDCARCRFAGQT